MRFAASHRKPARIYAHGNSRWQSCSHSNAIRNRRFNTRIELRTATRCRTQRRNTFATETTPAATAAHTRYLSSPAATTLHRKIQGFVLRLPPQNKAHATFMQIHAAITMHFAASRGKPASLHTWQHQMTTIMPPFQCDPQPQIQHTHRTTHTGTTTRCRTQRRNKFATETTPAATAALTRYLSSPAATTLHRKIQGFVLRLPPQSKAQATFMQIHAAITMHFAASRGKPASLHTWQHQMTTIMQPFHWDLKPQIQHTHRTTHSHSLQNTEEEHIRDRNDPSRNRRTHEVPFIAGCNHFTQKNARFRAPASSPKQSPSNIHAAITMHFAASRGKPASLHTWQHQMTTIMQPFHWDLKTQIQHTHRTTHNHSLQNTEEEHIRDRNDASRNRRAHEVPFIAACNHFTQKNTRFRAPASSPKQSPCNIHADSCSHYNAFCSITWQTCISTHMATPDDNNRAAVSMRSATADSTHA